MHPRTTPQSVWARRLAVTVLLNLLAACAVDYIQRKYRLREYRLPR